MLTVRPNLPYGPSEEEADATAMRKAMKGLGTDEKVIINILANRSNQQRQVISRKFNTLFGKVTSRASNILIYINKMLKMFPISLYFKYINS